MRNQKNKWIFKYFFPWQYDEEQNWLEEMAKEGWLLQRVGVGYHFRAAGPQNVIYRIDFVELGGKKLATYRKMFINSGWEYAASNLFGYQYYRIPVKRFSTDIYSDDVPSRIEHLRRIRYSALILAAVSVVIITPTTRVLVTVTSWEFCSSSVYRQPCMPGGHSILSARLSCCKEKWTREQ